MKNRLDYNELDLDKIEPSNIAPETFQQRRTQSVRCTYFQDGVSMEEKGQVF